MNNQSTESNLIQRLHQLIEDKRELDRISWDNLGDIIGYSGVGIKKALKNYRLSMPKLEEVINKIGLTYEAERIGFMPKSVENPVFSSKRIEKNEFYFKENILKSSKDLDRLESLVLDNWDSLEKRENFKNKLDLIAMRRINDIVDERVALILKKIQEEKTN